jgi:hypothetical protein
VTTMTRVNPFFSNEKLGRRSLTLAHARLCGPAEGI